MYRNEKLFEDSPVYSWKNHDKVPMGQITLGLKTGTPKVKVPSIGKVHG